MKIRSAILCAGAVSLAMWLGGGAIAADLTDVGYIDQADVANLPSFASANRQLGAYKAQLDSQYNAALKKAHTDAEKQQVALQFQQLLGDRQREIVGPLFQRAQLAIAAVAATRNLTIVVDKRIVIYGGQDITKDVETLYSSSQAIPPPAASPPPSEIGFVDQTVLDGVSKVQAANTQMQQFEATQRQIYSTKIALAKSDAEKQQIMQQYNKTVADKQDQLLKPLVDQTRSATADVARKKNLVLVVDKADVIFGGTDITSDVQNELAK
ncbi:MAG TPA: hypothetical protein VMU38_07990 [Candidatus Binatia bacterium]|nr:hypothetical protein [Candidatus Binatia bacterium]